MLTDADRNVLQDLVNDVHAQFVETLASNRCLDVAEVAALADGRIFSGRQAPELGLVDGLGTFREAVAIAGRTGRARRPPAPRSATRAVSGAPGRFSGSCGRRGTRVAKDIHNKALGHAEIAIRVAVRRREPGETQGLSGMRPQFLEEGR
jgi:ClpP class serine protease